MQLDRNRMYNTNNSQCTLEFAANEKDQRKGRKKERKKYTSGQRTGAGAADAADAATTRRKLDGGSYLYM